MLETVERGRKPGGGAVRERKMERVRKGSAGESICKKAGGGGGGQQREEKHVNEGGSV